MDPYSEIKTYIDNRGGNYANWYVGIAANPQKRLFVDHRVSEQGDFWIYCNAGTELTARFTEKRLLALGCKGGPCGGDHNTIFVYAYRITWTTVEAA